MLRENAGIICPESNGQNADSLSVGHCDNPRDGREPGPGDSQLGTMTILLRIANQVAYVWDVDDIATIRANHRICGVLAGTLPHLSQQNLFLGVPLVLMPEEVVLLVEIGTSKTSNSSNQHTYQIF